VGGVDNSKKWRGPVKTDTGGCWL